MSFAPSFQHETAASICPAVDGYHYSCTFDATPFAFGVCRAAFKGVYHATIPYIGPRNGKSCVSKVFFEQHRDLLRGWKPDLTISARANEMATLFNQNFPTNKPITFQVPIVARIVKLGHNHNASSAKRDSVGTKAQGNVSLHIGDTVAIEDFLEGNFEKFNSNNGWVCRDSILMPAFSHFTWWQSNGAFVVCDLQGVRQSNGYLLTDPAIHSLREEYGITDLGAAGISCFFGSHRCNDICANLPLPTTMDKSVVMDYTPNQSTSFTSSKKRDIVTTKVQ